MSRVIALIESRSESARLPNKFKEQTAQDLPLLKHVHDRVSLSKIVGTVDIVAPYQDILLLEFCGSHGFTCILGRPEHKGDVMRELLRAARGWDVIVEITGDCPCIDPQIIDTVVESHLSVAHEFTRYTDVKGAEVRVVDTEALERAVKHVHEWRRNGTTIFYEPFTYSVTTQKIASLQAFACRDLNFSVDTAEDLAFVRAIYKELEWDAPLNQIMEFVDSHPNISALATAAMSSPTPAQTTAASSASPGS